MVEILLQNGADPNHHVYYRNANGEPIWLYTLNAKCFIEQNDKIENYKIIMALLKANKTINAATKDENGKSLLHLTTNSEFAKELIRQGTDINAQDNDGVTALMALAINATQENKLHEAFKMALYNCGPALGLKDGWGNTILDYANQPQIKDVLEKYMSDLNIRIEEGTGLIPNLVDIIVTEHM